MDKRKNLPIGMGPITEELIEELTFFYRLNAHELIRRLIADLEDDETMASFVSYNKMQKTKRIEKSSRIKGFKFKEADLEYFVKMQWKCRFRGLSTFIKQLIYFNYEKHIGEIDTEKTFLSFAIVYIAHLYSGSRCGDKGAGETISLFYFKTI